MITEAQENLNNEHQEFLDKTFPNEQYNFGWFADDDSITTKIYTDPLQYVTSYYDEVDVIKTVVE